MEIIYPGNGNTISLCLLNNYHTIPLMNGYTLSMINIHDFLYLYLLISITI